MPIYESNGKRYNIPEDKVNDFTSKRKDAKIVEITPFYLSNQQPKGATTANPVENKQASVVQQPQEDISVVDTSRLFAGKTSFDNVKGGVSLRDTGTVGSLGLPQNKGVGETFQDLQQSGKILPKTANEKQSGFWAGDIGNSIEKLGSGVARFIGGLAQTTKRSDSTLPLHLQETNNTDPDALTIERALFGTAQNLSEKGNPAELMTDSETGEVRQKKYSDYWKEGKLGRVVRDVMLTATESLPQSIAAFIPYAGLPIVAMSAAGMKYNELDSNPELQGMEEWKKILNAAVSGAVEGITEKIGAKVDTSIFEPLLKNITEETVKKTLTKGGINMLIQSLSEGGEEILSGFGSNSMDYLTGVTDEWKPLEGGMDSFIYGMGGGMQFGALTGAGTAYRATEVAQRNKNLKTADQTASQHFPNWEQVKVNVEQSTFTEREASIADIYATDMAPEAKKAYTDFVKAKNAVDIQTMKREQYKKQELVSMEQRASNAVDAVVNPQTNSIIIANVPGMKEIRVYGDIVLNEDGTIDEKQSKDIFYTDDQGKRHVVSPKFVEILENTPAEVAKQELINITTTQIANRQANEEVRPYDQGEVITFTPDGANSLLGQIAGRNEDGSYMIMVDGAPEPIKIEPRMIIPEDNLRGVENGTEVQYKDQQGNVQTGIVDDAFTLRSQGKIVVGGSEVNTTDILPLDEMTENTPINEVFPGDSTNNVQDNTAIIEQNEITPEQQAQIQAEQEKEQFIQSLPVIDKGKNQGQVDQSQMTPEQNVKYFEYTFGKDKALQAAEKQVQNLKKAVKREQTKLDNDPFNITQVEKVAEVQSQLDAYSTYVNQEKIRLTEENIKNTPKTSVAESNQSRKEDIQLEEAGRTGEADPAIIEKWNSADKVEGIEDIITLANGEKIEGRYILTTAEALSPSHDVARNFAKTKGFPVNEQGNTVNDRDYEADKTAQGLVLQRANKYDERAVQTPVVVSQDGIVLSGNDRTMAGQIAASNDTDGAYIDYIERFADRWGFIPEQILETPNPRIVFVPNNALPYNTATFAKFNAEEKKTQNSLETAIKASKSISREVFLPLSQIIDRFEKLNDYYINEPAIKKTIDLLLKNGVVQTNELPRLMDGAVLSAEGRSYLETLMLGSVLSEKALREVDLMRSVRQTLMRTMPQLFRNSSLSEYSLMDELNNAIHLLYEAKQNGSAVKLHLNQGNLFDLSAEEIYNETEKTLSLMLESEKDTDFRAMFDAYNQKAVQIEAGQVDLFDGSLAKAELLTKILERYGQNQAESNKQTGTPKRINRGSGRQTEQAGTGEQQAGERGGDQVVENQEIDQKNVDQLGNNANFVENKQENETEVSNKGTSGKFRESNEVSERAEEPLNKLRRRIEEAQGNAQIGSVEVIKIVQQFAKENNLWIPFTEANKLGTPFVSGNENTNYLNQEDGYVYKVNNLMNDRGDLVSFINRVDLHNLLFPEVKYEFVGFTGFDYSSIYPIIRQKFIDNATFASEEDIDNYMRSLGLKPTVKTAEWTNGEYTINDIRPRNVLIDIKGNVYVIDAGIEKIAEQTPINILEHAKNIVKNEEIRVENEKVDPKPSEAQKQAGNYKKGHINVQGFDITIENPAGSVRSGIDENGNEWSNTMQNHYGYFKRTEGKDGDQIDVFVGNKPESTNIFVIDQVNPETGVFDESKVMLGFETAQEAEQAYLSNYEENWDGLDGLTETDIDSFKTWLYDGAKQRKAFKEYKKPGAQQKEYGADNKGITTERYNELRERMRKKLNNLNVGFDPELFSIGAEMAAYHMEAGARKFADYASKMIGDLGDAVRPYLKSFYEGVRAMGNSYEGMDSYKYVKEFDIENFNPKQSENLTDKTAENQKDSVPLNDNQPQQGSLFDNQNNKQDGSEQESDSRRNNRQPESDRRGLSESEQIQEQGTSSKDTSITRKSKRGKSNVSSDQLGERPKYDLNKEYSNEEIHEIVSSVTEIKDDKVVITGEVTDDIKTIAGRYKSGGIAKKGRGVLDEYYTNDMIVSAVRNILQNYFKPNSKIRALEPSVGTGNFIQAFPTTNSNVVSFEINETTARIAKILHPNIEVNLRSFETEFIDEKGNKKPMPEKYDLVGGNPPYGQHRGKYKGLGEESRISRYEDYFVKRSLDVLKENGILAMVLPSGWMNRHIIENGYKIEVAYRLPVGVFEATGIGTDIVVLKKQSGYKAKENHNYFDKNPQNILGEIKERTNRFGKIEEYVDGDIDSAMEALNQAEARKIVNDLRLEQSEDVKSLNDLIQEVKEAIKETASKEGAKGVIKATRPKKGSKVSKGGKIELTPNQLKYELNRGLETVPASNQFPNEFTKEEAEAFKDTDYSGVFRHPEKHKKHANYYHGKWIHDFYYAEGNIYEKLEQLELDKGNISQEQYDKQKKMLQDVMPERKTLSDININPNTVFVKNLHLSPKEQGEEQKTLQDMFLDFAKNLPRDAFGNDSGYWEVRGYVLNEQVYGQDKSRNQLIRERRKRIGKDLFDKFLNEELTDKHKKQVEHAFNREYNAVYRPDYSKVPMFSSIHKEFRGKPFELTNVQKSGIGRMTVKGVGLLAHDVGFGKTLSAILSMHEAMERGFTQRPLIVVPNDSILKQWVETINDILPQATVNVLGNLGVNYNLTDFNVNDGEYTIVTYQGFKKLGFESEVYVNLAQKFNYISDADLKKQKSERDKEKEKADVEESAGKMQSQTLYSFEDFGFDFMTFDEVHNANHIIGKIKLDRGEHSDFRSQSQNTSDLGIKTWVAAQYIQQQNNGRNVLLLSATPFTNKPLEYYSILSLIANSTLERMGFYKVDQFFETFMESESGLEIAADGTPKEKTDVRRFRNNGMFNQLLSEVIDIKGELDNPDLVRPERINKEYKIPQNELTEQAFAEAQVLLRSGETVLSGLTQSRLIAFSPYASYLTNQIPSSYKEFVENSPKIHDTIKLIDQNKKDNPGAGQIIYSELGVEYFQFIRDYLILESKFKPSEVAIIAGPTSATDRARIQNAFNKGDIKIILGSPAIKEGMNLQENTTDMYLLSLSYNFTQLRQVEGRGWRQGNNWENIRINYMLTNDSIDVFMLQRLQTKQGMYNEAMKQNVESVDVGDISTEELKNALITDPATRASLVVTVEKKALENEKMRINADLAFVLRKYDSFNSARSKVEDKREIINSYKEKAEQTGEQWWANYAKGEEVNLKRLENELLNEKLNLAKKGVNIDEIEIQTNNSKAQVEAIDNKIKGLDDVYKTLFAEYKKEREEALKSKGDLLEKHLQDRAEENKNGFYSKRVNADVPKFMAGKTPVYYSTVERALNRISQEKGTSDQFKAMLLKNGAKQAELDWMGFDSLPDKLTKSDIQDWINQNKIAIEEVEHTDTKENRRFDREEAEQFFNNDLAVFGIDYEGNESLIEDIEDLDRFEEFALDEAFSISQSPTKYSKYTLEGGKNYKELLLTMPDKQKSESADDISNRLYGKNYLDLHSSQRAHVNFTLDDQTKNKSQFKSSHFSEANILAHIRFDERDVNGERVLFVQEIQSDWAQEGRKKGFKQKISTKDLKEAEDRVAKIRLEIRKTEADYSDVVKRLDSERKDWTLDKEPELINLQKKSGELSLQLMQASLTLQDMQQNNAVADMPFKKTDQWVNLALRRMMRYAAENGFDRIAWTTGEQQADRYDLSKQVDVIAHRKDGDKYFVSAIVKGVGNPLNGGIPMSESELEDHVGKDIAQKIVNEEGVIVNYAATNEPRRELRELSGEDLKVGGEGMKSFYNNIIPKAANKLGKPFGAQVEDIEISFGDELQVDNVQETVDDLVARYYDDQISRTELEDELSALGYTANFNGMDGQLESVYNNRKMGVSTVQSLPVTQHMSETLIQGIPMFQAGQVGELSTEYTSPYIEEIENAKIAFNNATTKSEKFAAAQTLVDEIESIMVPIAESTVVNSRSEVLDRLEMLNAPKSQIAKMREVHSPLSGVYFKGEAVLNASDADNADYIIEEWIHENGHAYFEDNSQILLPLEGKLSDSFFKEVLPDDVYDDIDEYSKIEEVVVRLSGYIYGGRSIGNHADLKHVEPAIYEYLNYITDGRFSEHIRKLGQQKRAYDSANENNETGTRTDGRNAQTRAEASQQRALERYPVRSGKEISGRSENVDDGSYPPMPQYRDGQSLVEYAKEVGEWFNGRVKSSNKRPKFMIGSVSQAAEAAGSNMTEQLRQEYDIKYSRFATRFREAWEDMYLPVKQFLDVLRDSGVHVAEYNDFYKQATAISGKNDAQLDHFRKAFQKPITAEISKLQKLGFTYRDIENYVFAKHGLERNDYMVRDEAKNNYAKDLQQIEKDYQEGNLDEEGYEAAIDNINQQIEDRYLYLLESKDYAGITALEKEFDKSAENYISEFEEKAGKENITSLWDKIKKATDYSLERQYKSGIMSKDVYDELKVRYNSYVPLRGHDAVTAEDRWDYSPDMGTYFTAPILKAEGKNTYHYSMTNPFILLVDHGQR